MKTPILIFSLLLISVSAFYHIWAQFRQAQIECFQTLKAFEAMLSHFGFIRIYHAALINMKHIKKYMKGDSGYVFLTNNFHKNVSRRKTEVLLQTLEKN